MAQYEAFEIVTSESKTRLALEETLTGWQDQSDHRMVEHTILNRDGAIHQSRGQAARRFIFKILLRDPGASDTYKAIEATLAREPFVSLIHPRLGRVSAAYNGLKAVEELDARINGMLAELSLTETGLREIQAVPAAGAALEAVQATDELVALAMAGSFLTLALAVQTAVLAFVDALNGGAAQYDLAQALQAVAETTGAFASTAGVDVSVARPVAAARFAYGRCLEAFQRSGAVNPVKEIVTTGTMSLARLAQSLAGGGARSYEAEIMRLNRIPSPYAIPGGSRLLIPNPEYLDLSGS